MDWTRDLPTWSHPGLSRRVAHGLHRWHVQESGSGQTILFLPGSGSSVHTWRDFIPVLAASYHVIALDLPGQGFTRSQAGARSGLGDMAGDIAELMRDQGWHPSCIVSHSAGTAIALRLAQMLDAETVIGVNPALDNFRGVAGWLFPALARALSATPFTASLFAASASPARSRKLIESTGSVLTPEGYSYYARLMRDRAHVSGTLKMMAHWSLDGLLADLPKITARTLLLTGGNDQAVPPDVSNRAAAILPEARVHMFPKLGHLAHEEAPECVLTEIEDYLP